MNWDSFVNWTTQVLRKGSTAGGTERDRIFAQISVLQDLVYHGQDLIQRWIVKRTSYGSYFPVVLLIHIGQFLSLAESALLPIICRNWSRFSIPTKALGNAQVWRPLHCTRPFVSHGMFCECQSRIYVYLDFRK